MSGYTLTLKLDGWVLLYEPPGGSAWPARRRALVSQLFLFWLCSENFGCVNVW